MEEEGTPLRGVMVIRWVVDVETTPTRLFGGSITIEKATDPRGDVLLAYEMNGQPLPRCPGLNQRYFNFRAASVVGIPKISRYTEN